MDTKFWGPSAWKLLHMAAFQYNQTTQHDDMSRFLSLLPFVLPCKFCRKSLTEYYEELPFEDHLGSQKELSIWLLGRSQKNTRVIYLRDVQKLFSMGGNFSSQFLITIHLVKKVGTQNRLSALKEPIAAAPLNALRSYLLHLQIPKRTDSIP